LKPKAGYQHLVFIIVKREKVYRKTYYNFYTLYLLASTMFASKLISNSTAAGRKSSSYVATCVAVGRNSYFSTPTTRRRNASTTTIDKSGFNKIGCVGLGLMGHGICQIAATSGVHSKIIAFEQEQRFLDSG
jgi:hypothetical protein